MKSKTPAERKTGNVACGGAGGIRTLLGDPIFIYTFDMGIAGAAYATIVSLGITSAVMLNWLLFKRDTYLTFKFKGFRFDRAITRDVFGVGVPASVMQLSMSLTILALNAIIVAAGGTDGVAIYTTGWRVASMAILPPIGIATAVVSVTGAAFGARSSSRRSVQSSSLLTSIWGLWGSGGVLLLRTQSVRRWHFCGRGCICGV